MATVIPLIESSSTNRLTERMTKSSTGDGLRFSRRTILAAIDLLDRLTQAELSRFFWDLGSPVASQIGEEGSVKKRLNQLIQYVDLFPDYQRDDGLSIQEAVVAKAAQILPEQYLEYEPKPEEIAFQRALERDGFTISENSLKRTLPAELQMPEAESEIEQLLFKYSMTTAKGHLDQARDAHARGNWAAANSQIRAFLEAVLDEIAEKIDPTAAALSSGHQRREKLVKLGFLRVALNEWESNGKGFINGLIRRLHPQGSHPGLSDQEDSTFRLHIVMLTARLLLRRFNHRGEP